MEIDIEAAAGRVASACRALPAVAAAYLFGSALGRCRPRSDIDVAIIRVPQDGQDDLEGLRAGLALEADLLDRLPPLSGHPFDVTVLEAGQPLFAMRVLRQGRLCFVRDTEAHTDFLEDVAQRHRENGPRQRQAIREVLEEEIGRHGH